MAGSSHEDISRAGFENNLYMEAIFGEIIYVSQLVKIIMTFFFRVFFSWPNIKVFLEDFLVVFVTGEKTWTDL